MTAPGDALVEPVPAAPIPDLVHGVLSIPSLVSPSFWIAELINVAIGVDPLAEAGRMLGGDWRGIARAASALRHLAEYDSRTADRLAEDAARMFVSWEGNAATAAADYFDRLSRAIRDHAPLLSELAAELDDAARSIWNIAQAVQGSLQELADAAIIGAIAFASGTALLETGVGAVAGYALTAFYIWKITSAWAEVLELFSRAVTIVQAATGVIGVATSRMGDLHQLALPSASYDHPGVPR